MGLSEKVCDIEKLKEFYFWLRVVDMFNTKTEAELNYSVAYRAI